jgi:hypothetical protein
VLEGALEEIREDGEDAEDHFWPRMFSLSLLATDAHGWARMREPHFGRG